MNLTVVPERRIDGPTIGPKDIVQDLSYGYVLVQDNPEEGLIALYDNGIRVATFDLAANGLELVSKRSA